MSQPTVVISINAAWNIYNFRRGLVAALRDAGWRVVALAPEDGYGARLAELGIEFIPLAMDAKGVSPARDLALLAGYWRQLRHLRPALFLGFTAKPNIYGSLAAQALGIPVMNNVSGLGTAFIRRSLLTRLVSLLYRFAFRRSATIFFQNEEDRTLFVAGGLVAPIRALLLPGSGVDLDRFRPAPLPASAGGPLRFLLAARMLWDKGIGEFVEAARRLRGELPGARFALLGFADADNRTAISRTRIESWVGEGVVEYLGASDDVRPYIADSDCIVLPSYREGMPRILLEAAAMARPLIATDVPGCRQVVRDGENGFLCPPRDALGLAEAMKQMARLPAVERERMGAAGRARVERDFDERVVVSSYLDRIAALNLR